MAAHLTQRSTRPFTGPHAQPPSSSILFYLHTMKLLTAIATCLLSPLSELLLCPTHFSLTFPSPSLHLCPSVTTSVLPCPRPPRRALRPLCYHSQPLSLSLHSYYSLHDLLNVLSDFLLHFPLWNASSPKAYNGKVHSMVHLHARHSADAQHSRNGELARKGCGVDDQE